MPPSNDQPDPKQAVEARLCDYLEGELSPADAADVDRHLAANPTHRQLLADLAEHRRWLRAVPPAVAPAEVGEPFREQAERALLMYDAERPVNARGRWSQLPLVAALVLLTAGLGAALTYMLTTPAAPGPTGPVAARLPTISAGPVTPTTAPQSPPAAAPAEPAAGPAAAPVPPLATAPAALAANASSNASSNANVGDLAANANADANGGRPSSLRRDASTPTLDKAKSATPPPPTQLAQTPGAASTERDGQQQQALAQVVKPAQPGRTIRLSVATADPAAVERQLRAFAAAAGGLVARTDPPTVPLAPSPALRGGGGGGGFARAEGRDRRQSPANAPARAATTPTTAARQFTVAGLTARQAAALTADLSAAAGPGSAVTTDAATPPPITPGQSVVVTIPQLAGRAGLSATNAVRVAADGTVALPMIDPVPAAGATPAQLADRVADRYRRANLIARPTVTVTTAPPPATRPADLVTVTVEVRPTGR